MPEVVIVFSGGMDSTTLLAAQVADRGPDDVVCLTFDYGSKHGAREQAAAKLLCQRYGARQEVFELPIGKLFHTALLKGGGPIPSGEYTPETQRSTVVHFRNGMMLSVAVGFAESF